MINIILVFEIFCYKLLMDIYALPVKNIKLNNVYFYKINLI